MEQTKTETAQCDHTLISSGGHTWVCMKPAGHKEGRHAMERLQSEKTKYYRLPAPFVLTDEDELDRSLQDLNQRGVTPALVGVDASGTRFLAYGWAPGGDGWVVNVCLDDPYSREYDRTDGPRCEKCHSEGRLPVTLLTFPVVVL